MTRTNLRVVAPTEEPIDIAALNRADIRERDWAAVHVAGDRAKPLPMWERVKRTWRG